MQYILKIPQRFYTLTRKTQRCFVFKRQRGSVVNTKQLTMTRCVEFICLNHLFNFVFPEFNQPIRLNIDTKVTEMMIYSGVSYFF